MHKFDVYLALFLDFETCDPSVRGSVPRKNCKHFVKYRRKSSSD